MRVAVLILQILFCIGFGYCAIMANTLSWEIVFLICGGISGHAVGKNIGNLINEVLHR